MCPSAISLPLCVVMILLYAFVCVYLCPFLSITASIVTGRLHAAFFSGLPLPQRLGTAVEFASP